MDGQHMDYWPNLHRRTFSQPHERVLEVSPEMSSTPSLSGSPAQSDFDAVSPTNVYHGSFSSHLSSEEMNYPYQLPLTPTEFCQAEDAMYCGSTSHVPELSYPPMRSPMTVSSLPAVRMTGGEPRTHATSGRRRAQNRAAQRAFRERKEKHARDLEEALAALNDKYRRLETSHTELSAAYEKLKKAIELLTEDDGGGGVSPRSGPSKETLRRLLEIIQGEVVSRAIPMET